MFVYYYRDWGDAWDCPPGIYRSQYFIDDADCVWMVPLAPGVWDT